MTPPPNPFTPAFSAAVRIRHPQLLATILEHFGTNWTMTKPASALLSVVGTDEDLAQINLTIAGLVKVWVSLPLGDNEYCLTISDRTRTEHAQPYGCFQAVLHLAKHIPGLTAAHRRQIDRVLRGKTS